MGQFQTFPVGGKDHAVIADHIAAAQCGEPDGAALARAGDAVAPAIGHRVK